MTENEVLTLALSGISIVVSLIALFKSSTASSRANEISAEQLKLNHAQVEIDLRNQISESKRQVRELVEQHADFLARPIASLTQEEIQRRDRIKVISNQAIEEQLSTLDSACQKYIDEKIDKERFKKSYQREIRQIVQDDTHAEFFRTGHAYNALMRVYNSWENPEA
jgi:hypothetical protein